LLKGITATTAAGIAMPNLLLRAQETPAEKKLAIGCIGDGGKGFSDMMSASWQNEIVAISDVDANHLANMRKKPGFFIRADAGQFRPHEGGLEFPENLRSSTRAFGSHSHPP
jgi:hypothetical protein